MQNKIDWRQKWIGAYLGGRPSTSIRDSQYKGLNKKWEKRGKDSFDSYDYFGPTLRQGGSHGFLLLGREEREIFVELFFEESAILLDEQDSFSERISFLFDSWMMDSQHIIHFEHLLFHQSITVFSQRVYPFCNYWSCWFAIIFGSLLAFRIFFLQRGIFVGISFWSFTLHRIVPFLEENRDSLRLFVALSSFETGRKLWLFNKFKNKIVIPSILTR